MQNNEAEAIRISRLLTPENKTQLLTWVNLAFFAENSAKKSLGIDAVVDGVSISKPQEYFCGKLLRRSKK
ncbi:hypothetical protein [Treponema sp. R80B11-R83G3]